MTQTIPIHIGRYSHFPDYGPLTVACPFCSRLCDVTNFDTCCQHFVEWRQESEGSTATFEKEDTDSETITITITGTSEQAQAFMSTLINTLVSDSDKKTLRFHLPWVELEVIESRMKRDIQPADNMLPHEYWMRYEDKGGHSELKVRFPAPLPEDKNTE